MGKPLVSLIKPTVAFSTRSALESIILSSVVASPLLFDDITVQEQKLFLAATFTSFARAYLSGPKLSSWKSFLSKKNISYKSLKQKFSFGVNALATLFTGAIFYKSYAHFDEVKQMVDIFFQNPSLISSFAKLPELKQVAVETPSYLLGAYNFFSIAKLGFSYYASMLSNKLSMRSVTKDVPATLGLVNDSEQVFKKSAQKSDTAYDIAHYYFSKNEPTKALAATMEKVLLEKELRTGLETFDTSTRMGIIYYDALENPTLSFINIYFNYFNADERKDLLNYYAQKGITQAREKNDLQQLSLFSLYTYQQNKYAGLPLLQEVATKMSEEESLESIVLAEGASGGVKTLRFANEKDIEQPISLLLVKKESLLDESPSIKEEYDLIINAKKIEPSQVLVPEVIQYGVNENSEYVLELRYSEPTLREFALKNDYDVVKKMYEDVYTVFPIFEQMMSVSEKLDLYQKYPSLRSVVDVVEDSTCEFVPLHDAIDRNMLITKEHCVRRIDFSKKGLGTPMFDIVNLTDHSFDVLSPKALKEIKQTIFNSYQEKYDVNDEQLYLHYLGALRLRLDSFQRAWTKPGRNEDFKRLISFEIHCYDQFKLYASKDITQVSVFAKDLMSLMND